MPMPLAPVHLRRLVACALALANGAAMLSESNASSADEGALPQAKRLEPGDRLFFVGGNAVGDEGGLHNHFRRSVVDAIGVIETEARIYYGTQLEDQFTDEVRAAIREGSFDYVVFTTGSDEDMTRFAAYIREQGAQPVALLAWDEFAGKPGTELDVLLDQIREAAPRAREWSQASGTPVVPHGLALADLLRDPPSAEIPLRSDFPLRPGTIQQNDIGMILNVASLYAALTGDLPKGLPAWEPFPQRLIHAAQERAWLVAQAWSSGEDLHRFLGESPRAPRWEPILKDTYRVLYIGNSFIGGEGGLDNHFRRMVAKADPPIRVFNESQIYWGTPLSRMTTERAFDAIRDGGHDLIVFTSGDDATMRIFAERIQESGARAMIHMTWARNPSIEGQTLERYREETEELALRLKAFESTSEVPVAPCGLVFYDLIVDPPPVEGLRFAFPYIEENIHQNDLGTLVNAYMHYAIMTGRSPVGLPAYDPYPPGLIRAIQERVWIIAQQWKADEVAIKPLPTAL